MMPERYLALDFETSGLNVKTHAPVSIGIAVMERGEVVNDTFYSIIGPPVHYKTGKIEREYNIPSLEVSGITWKEIKNGPMPKATLVKIKAWVEANDAARLPVVAFNSPFDLSFWSELLFLSGGYNRVTNSFEVPVSPLLGPWYCAMQLAKAGLTLPDYKLATVATHFDLDPQKEPHNALDDAILAGKVFWELAK
jgi:DNA polymerase III epsilon subunit-like protein